ncbi:biotin-dependent carboxyltransferase family protein [Herbiconiux moechotypicola]|uniref:Biotin-dependent carboxyltransferase family protein n=1 Tax=Herbiconiux moechotypicola TaxID=637393 RepID=A0ABN3D627_9MICO|nr:biotin-dependent carboxyltransferase family protein [Herbiconiux moechotypicola]MCS5728660.1 biotin-dependent carboxyltransferase family protein [Herbiconiux moechotypicola]
MRGEGAGVRTLRVLDPGPLALLEDGGRPGFAHVGVTASGAADRGAWRAANRLVGNPPGEAAIEALGGGLTVSVSTWALVAVTGAPGAVTVVGPEARRGASGSRSRVVHPVGRSFVAAPGEVIALDTPSRGLRRYLAVRGGLDVPPTLGSRSTDVLSGLGPAPLAAGAKLSIGDAVEAWPAADFVRPFADDPQARGAVVLEVTPGPRADWFGAAGWRLLLGGEWEVQPDSNRVGVRIRSLDGGLARAEGSERELPSEGMVAGSVQVPPDGHPVLFFRDHPVTGGYPVIAVLTASALDRVAQLRPGDRVRFADQPKSMAASR